MHLLIMVGVVWTENISCVFRVACVAGVRRGGKGERQAHEARELRPATQAIFRVKLPFSNYSVVVCNGPETLCCKPRFHSIYNEPDKLGRHELIKSYTLAIPTFY